VKVSYIARPLLMTHRGGPTHIVGTQEERKMKTIQQMIAKLGFSLAAALALSIATAGAATQIRFRRPVMKPGRSPDRSRSRNQPGRPLRTTAPLSAPMKLAR